LSDERHSRTTALLGDDAMARLAAARVLVVGVGGVGGWCAEALARTGVGGLVLIDDDTVVASNLNRQCAATEDTLGCVKVEAMRRRLAAVNPDCRVAACHVRYPDASITLAGFDVVVDAIDSVDCKAELILDASSAGVPLVSSMGAALRLDPARVRASRFEKVAGDGLARALRQRFKRLARRPGAFTAVWSDEVPRAAETLGSVMPVVAAFGMCLAAEVLRLIVGEERR